MLRFLTRIWRGGWQQTYTGRMFYPFDPKPEDVCIEDIAHSLSLQCRFGGHCAGFYSVAEHCVRGSHHLRGESALHFLLHDAAETYLIDLPRPLKRTGLFGWLYRRMERRVERVIAQAFNIPYPFNMVIKIIDERMLFTERRDLLGTPPHQWQGEGLFAPFSEYIVPMTPDEAEAAFLARYKALTLR